MALECKAGYASEYEVIRSDPAIHVVYRWSPWGERPVTPQATACLVRVAQPWRWGPA